MGAGSREVLHGRRRTVRSGIDEHRARTRQLTTDELLTCKATTFVDLVTELNASQCEQHARAILDRLQEVDYETYAKALIRVALIGSEASPPSEDEYFSETREVFPDVPMDDDILERLTTLMLLVMNRRLARHTTLNGPVLP